MEMSSDNPASDIAEGITKGVINLSLEKIGDLVQKLKDRKLAFIEEKKTIEIVKEQYHSEETKIYSMYIQDRKLSLLVKLGLTLRRLEGDEERKNSLRDKILKKYNLEGLHIAEFVENGLLNRYILLLLEKFVSHQNLKEDISDILNNIEKYTLFVLATSNPSEIIKKVDIKITYSPKIFIIAGFKYAAELVKQNTEKFKLIMKDYEFSNFSSGEKEILFFRKIIS